MKLVRLKLKKKRVIPSIALGEEIIGGFKVTFSTDGLDYKRATCILNVWFSDKEKIPDEIEIELKLVKERFGKESGAV